MKLRQDEPHVAGAEAGLFVGRHHAIALYTRNLRLLPDHGSQCPRQLG